LVNLAPQSLCCPWSEDNSFWCPPVLGCSSVDCNVVLTEAQGKFSSPCYPEIYRNGLTCNWTMQAPAGFIVQLTFLDFELEEAQNCMYDRVVVNTGSTESKFCGLTASGLTLNSTRNVMELSFVSDFSIRKKGFMVSFQHVAVALRNQKVKIPNGNGQIAKVTSSIPALNALTICFEVERQAFNQVLKMFHFESFYLWLQHFRVSTSFCILWTSSNGRVAVYFNGNYWGKTCSLTSGHTVPAGGNFHLGGIDLFKGNMYNLRLWDRAMSMQELKTLTCDMVGNIVDWDNSHWAISSSLAQTDNTLSCSERTDQPTGSPLCPAGLPGHDEGARAGQRRQDRLRRGRIRRPHYLQRHDRLGETAGEEHLQNVGSPHLMLLRPERRQDQPSTRRRREARPYLTAGRPVSPVPLRRRVQLLMFLLPSCRALRAVEKLAKKVEFVGPSMNITSKHLALGILALDSRSFNGTSFSVLHPKKKIKNHVWTPGDLLFLLLLVPRQIEFDRTANPLAQVTLPASLLEGSSGGGGGGLHRGGADCVCLFPPQKEQKGLSLNSYVVASSVGNLSIRDLRDPVKIEIAHLSDQVPECVFWDFTMNKGNGGWSNRGCNVSKQSSTNRTVCLCNHLTHFGILMDISQTSFQIDRENQKVLTFLSYIGCGISALCSAATLLTYIAFEKLRRDYPSKILMNLSASLLLLNIVFLLDGWLASMADSEGLCTSAAVLLHYFLLTSFTWMGLESVHMYIALVKVFNTYIRRYILKFCIVGWGLPAVLVGIIVSVNKNYYGVLKGREEDSGMICWIKEKSVFYTTCVGYFCLMFLLNVAMFIVVMMQICGRNGKRSNRTLREEVLRNLRSVVSLTFLLGMTWGFALFAWGPAYLTFTYLFTIFNSLQGLFIFIFHCALKENVQKQWRRYLCCGPYRLSENSDWSKTATNNTKKVSSDNLAKSLSSSSFGSSTINWTAKAKATLTPFSKRSRNAGEMNDERIITLKIGTTHLYHLISNAVYLIILF
uniref:Adhesion G-protein coupled receptor G6 n=1 Tax=Fundulus heteroclitus TaxID=8078 RepID=A0A3Q2PT89_FUNHE